MRRSYRFRVGGVVVAPAPILEVVPVSEPLTAADLGYTYPDNQPASWRPGDRLTQTVARPHVHERMVICKALNPAAPETLVHLLGRPDLTAWVSNSELTPAS